MFGSGKKSRDEEDRANNELRAKMEKLRLENALLKDQIRALSSLPPELSSLYVFIQPRTKITLAELRKEPRFQNVSDEQLKSNIERLIEEGLLEAMEASAGTYYSVKLSDMSEVYLPKKSEKKEGLAGFHAGEAAGE
jgi:hypothetical protein